MKNSRCRLCVADIPHDYDHSLEVEYENEVSQEFEEVTFDLIAQTTPSPSERWPDASGTAAVIFTLLVANLSLLLLFLIIWSSYLDNKSVSYACCRPDYWLVAEYCCAGVSFILNSVMAYVAEKKLESRVVLFFVVFAGVFWAGALIWTRMNTLE